MHHITAIGSDVGQIEQFFVGILGMRLVKRTVNLDDPSSPHLLFRRRDGTCNDRHLLRLSAWLDAACQNGAGLTHHFALSVSDEEA